MQIKNADAGDFDKAFEFICSLWTYNTYDKDEVRKVYTEILEDDNTFAFFIVDNCEYKGFCHGDYFNTFWMSGLTCYVSSLIVKSEDRNRGYGTVLMDHARHLALDRGCRAMILDSGMPRVNAHKFYENYGFEKSCYGFELILGDNPS